MAERNVLDGIEWVLWYDSLGKGGRPVAVAASDELARAISYMQHRSWCPALERPYYQNEPNPCSCGLSMLLQQREASDA